MFFFQRGHIYTSYGSFFIKPVENYTPSNQNILHKISRDKLPLDKVQFDEHLNGKLLFDEYLIGEDRSDETVASDYNFEPNDYNTVDGQYPPYNNSAESFVFCKTASDKSEYWTCCCLHKCMSFAETCLKCALCVWWYVLHYVAIWLFDCNRLLYWLRNCSALSSIDSLEYVDLF